MLEVDDGCGAWFIGPLEGPTQHPRTVRAALKPGLATALALVVSVVSSTGAQTGTLETTASADVSALVSPSRGLTDLSAGSSELAETVRRYSNDLRALGRRHDADGSAERRDRLRLFLGNWQSALNALDFDQLGAEGRIDWLLLRSHVDNELRELEREQKIWIEAAELLPFAETVLGLEEARRRRESVDPKQAAGALEQLTKALDETRKALERGLADDQKAKALTAPTPDAKGGEDAKGGKKPAATAPTKPDLSDDGPRLHTTKIIAHRAARLTEEMRSTLDDWYQNYQGYDPLFSWWTKDPHDKASKALEGYVAFLREKILGFEKGAEPGAKGGAPKDPQRGKDPPIIGDPVGREVLLGQLESELIAYTPEELIKIAEAELAWSEAEMRRAAREMGFGDDWKAALEKVKTLHVDPGQQPELVRDLAYEAIDFVEQRNLVTIPPLAKEIWRIEMMSPERQKMNPFFLGGEVIRVSFPTDTMTHEEKEMSLRGNNVHFSRATVHHELIPGHHLQGFMTSRYNSHRQAFSTPFWTEGWALYWELLLWDLDFPRSPEDRIGMLFWRMHRCARVIWSLGFHLGNMTPQQAVDFLVERIGHERENATGEVRRSFEANYSPLYQLAYLMGGLQFRALRRELVESGAMTDREFHDRILEGGSMPVEMVRARITGQVLGRDHRADWKFERREPAGR